jgi:hypothetical protein
MGPAEPSTKGFVVSKLNCDGSNWITWKDQTLMILSAGKGLKWHIEGTAYLPPPLPTFSVGHFLTDDELANVEAAEQ